MRLRLRTLFTVALVAALACPSFAIAGEDEDLITAVQSGEASRVEKLIKAGADVNFQGNHGNTPLNWAVFKGNADLVRFLLKNGADTTIPNSLGQKAIDLARTYGTQEIVSILESNTYIPAKRPTPKPAEAIELPPLRNRVDLARGWYSKHIIRPTQPKSAAEIVFLPGYGVNFSDSFATVCKKLRPVLGDTQIFTRSVPYVGGLLIFEEAGIHCTYLGRPAELRFRFSRDKLAQVLVNVPSMQDFPGSDFIEVIARIQESIKVYDGPNSSMRNFSAVAVYNEASTKEKRYKLLKVEGEGPDEYKIRFSQYIVDNRIGKCKLFATVDLIHSANSWGRFGTTIESTLEPSDSIIQNRVLPIAED